MPDDDKAIEVWNRVLTIALKLPGAKVNRNEFLKKELSPRCTEEQVRKAIESSPAKAGISKDAVEKASNGCINWHTAQATALSFGAGLPGGWWIAGTIPADLTQFYWHVLQLVQKLAYLHGWPDLDLADDEFDDETLLRITLFIGVMSGVREASIAVAELARRLSLEVSKRLPQMALTKYGLYNVAKQVCKWIGIRLTKGAFAGGIAKVIPFLGGLFSGGITLFSIKKMGNNLKKHLAGLSLAEP